MSAPAHVWQRAFPEVVDWDVPVERGLLDDLLCATVKASPAKVAIDFRNRSLSYGELGDQVTQLAAGLWAQGIRPGERVALFLCNTPWHPICFFALARIGAVIVHLSPMDAVRELQQKLTVTGARRLITLSQSAFVGRAMELLGEGAIDELWVAEDAVFGPVRQPQADITYHPRIRPLSDLMQADTPPEWPHVDTDDVVVLQFTGGTTGAPKAAMLTHANLRASVSAYAYWQDTGYEEPAEVKAIGVLPLFHIYALVTVLLRNVRSGGTILLHERFDAEAILRDIDEKRATAFAAVPTMWIALLNHPKAAEVDYSSLVSCVSGGAPLAAEVLMQLERLTQQRILSGWGMSETASAGTRMPMRTAPRGGLIGIPMSGIEMRVVDLDNPSQPVAVGDIGEIAVRGPNLFQGYYNDEVATQTAFAGGYFLTGDIGRMDTDGVFEIVDRRKNMILSGGFNVYPANIENSIYEHPSVEEVIVIGIDDAYRGQAAKAFIKLKAGAEPFSVEDLQAFLSTRLGRHELPRALEFRDALPRSAAGKLLARTLIEEEAAKVATSPSIHKA